MNKRDEILELLENVELLKETADDSIIGFVERAGDSSLVLYDKNKLFEHYELEPLHIKKSTFFLQRPR